jgi:hypothetical protein
MGWLLNLLERFLHNYEKNFVDKILHALGYMRIWTGSWDGSDVRECTQPWNYMGQPWKGTPPNAVWRLVKIRDYELQKIKERL